MILSDDEMVAGLKEALDRGTQFAVDKLGQEGGFLNNRKVRIPMPDSLAWVEKSLRSVGQDELADEFIATMNRAGGPGGRSDLWRCHPADERAGCERHPGWFRGCGHAVLSHTHGR
jgi:hypothetical protein